MRLLKSVIILIALTALATANNAFPSLTLTTSVRADAMGGVVVPGTDADNLYLNPASLRDVKDRQIYAVYHLMALDSYHTYLTYASPLDKKSGYAISMGMLNGGQIEINPFIGASVTKNAEMDMSLGLSYGRQITRDISAGVTVKGLYSNLAEQYTAYAFGLDLGARYTTFEEITYSLSVLNLGIATSYLSEADSLPLSFLLGVSYPFKFDRDNLLLAGITGEYPLNSAIKGELGLEYSYSSIVFVRAGYRLNCDTGNITGGVGIKQELKNFGTIGIDFAYLYGNNWYDSYKIAVSFKY